MNRKYSLIIKTLLKNDSHYNIEYIYFNYIFLYMNTPLHIDIAVLKELPKLIASYRKPNLQKASLQLISSF